MNSVALVLLIQSGPGRSELTSASFPSIPLRTCSWMNLALLSSSSSSCFFFLACSSWRRMVSGSRSTYWMYQPLGVSSTLHKPASDPNRLVGHEAGRTRNQSRNRLPFLPSHLVKSVRVSHWVEFMWTCSLWLMYSL